MWPVWGHHSRNPRDQQSRMYSPFWPNPGIPIIANRLPATVVVNHYHLYGGQQQLQQASLSPANLKYTNSELADNSFDCNGIVHQDAPKVSLVEDSPVVVKWGTVENSSLCVNTSKRPKSTLTKIVKKAKLLVQGTKYSDKGFTTSLSSAKEAMIPGKRIIARRRTWSSETRGFGDWMVYRREDDNDDSLQFVMRRGGVIEFFPALVDNIVDVHNEMLDVEEFRQYSVRDCANEPRVHVLFSSTTAGEGGYQYGKVKMANHPLQSLPVISDVAAKLASEFKLENSEWNIGCNLILYRNGKDSISWHADDTQGEDVVLSLTVESPPDPRTICFQPANTMELQMGDEQIELYPIAGDAYSMDGIVQAGYVHAMLKVTEATQIEAGKRMSIIFRNGIPKKCDADSGRKVDSLAAPCPTAQYTFGAMGLIEGECYSKDFLFNGKAHQNAFGNVDGNKNVGCPSVFVCNLSHERDEDHFQFLTYVAGDDSRPLALLRSLKDRKPIRVFRSSAGSRQKGLYFPENPLQVVYRYDGLYYIIAARDRHGEIGESKDARVFYMVRAKPPDEMELLYEKYPSAGMSLWDGEQRIRVFSTKPSERLHEKVQPWDIQLFHDWNPLRCTV